MVFTLTMELPDQAPLTNPVTNWQWPEWKPTVSLVLFTQPHSRHQEAFYTNSPSHTFSDLSQQCPFTQCVWRRLIWSSLSWIGTCTGHLQKASSEKPLTFTRYDLNLILAWHFGTGPSLQDNKHPPLWLGLLQISPPLILIPLGK